MTDDQGNIVTLGPRYEEKKPALSEYSRQQGEDSTKYWVGKNSENQKYLIFQNCSYYVFGSPAPTLPSLKFIHSYSYWERSSYEPVEKREAHIDEKLEEISKDHKKNYAVFFSKRVRWNFGQRWKLMPNLHRVESTSKN